MRRQEFIAALGVLRRSRVPSYAPLSAAFRVRNPCASTQRGKHVTAKFRAIGATTAIPGGATDPAVIQMADGQSTSLVLNLVLDEDGSRLMSPSQELQHDPEQWTPVFGKDHAPGSPL